MNDRESDNRFRKFRLGDQFYAIPLLTVKEVIPKPAITAVLNMPAHFEAMLDLCGQVVGVFNVRKKLSGKPRSATAETAEVISVIDQNSVQAGIMADEVTRVLNPAPDLVRPAPIKDDDPTRHFIGSVIQVDKDLALTLNFFNLVEMNKIKLNGQAA